MYSSLTNMVRSVPTRRNVICQFLVVSCRFHNMWSLNFAVVASLDLCVCVCLRLILPLLLIYVRHGSRLNHFKHPNLFFVNNATKGLKDKAWHWEILANSQVHSDDSSAWDKVQHTVRVEMWEQNTKQHPEMTGMFSVVRKQAQPSRWSRVHWCAGCLPLV